MSKYAIVATIKTVPGKRDEYLTFLKAPVDTADEARVGGTPGELNGRALQSG